MAPVDPRRLFDESFEDAAMLLARTVGFGALALLEQGDHHHRRRLGRLGRRWFSAGHPAPFEDRLLRLRLAQQYHSQRDPSRNAPFRDFSLGGGAKELRGGVQIALPKQGIQTELIVGFRPRRRFGVQLGDGSADRRHRVEILLPEGALEIAGQRLQRGHRATEASYPQQCKRANAGWTGLRSRFRDPTVRRVRSTACVLGVASWAMTVVDGSAAYAQPSPPAVLVAPGAATDDADPRLGRVASGFARAGFDSFVAGDMVRPPPGAQRAILRARRQLRTAERLRQRQRFADAAVAADQAIAQLERHVSEEGHIAFLVDAYVNRGAIALAVDDPITAETVFLRAVALKPQHQPSAARYPQDVRDLFAEVRRASRMLRYGSVRVEVPDIDDAHISVDFGARPPSPVRDEIARWPTLHLRSGPRPHRGCRAGTGSGGATKRGRHSASAPRRCARSTAGR